MKNPLSFISKHHHHLKKPADVVCRTYHLLLLYSDSNCIGSKQQKKIDQELNELIENLHVVLYGKPETLPDPKACAQVTAEFFKENTRSPFRLLISCFPKLEWQCQKHVSEVVASLLSHQVNSRLIAAEYVEENLDIVDVLMNGLFDSEDTSIALLYDLMVRECIRRSQRVARYVLESEQHMKRILECVQAPNYTFASHVGETLELLLTRHRTAVAEFLSKNYEWFFSEFNSKLLESHNVLTKFHAVKVLGNMLVARSSHDVMIRFVSSTNNLRIVMNLLRESKSTQLNAFNVFKLFVANQHKPKGVVDILTLNRSKLLRFLDGLTVDLKDEEQFEADKAQVMREIIAMQEIE
ncbi:hypothetical protein L1049_002926 [Liquidambar formosana]|uniref:Mo25-like protein n=1 Tax=Liquidambar formosana TaxID=63359 RepID=A0AAP0NFW4_LIQFO